jgi:hypothetical protein
LIDGFAPNRPEPLSRLRKAQRTLELGERYLAMAADAANADVPKGRPEDLTFYKQILNLAHIWRMATGDCPRQSRDNGKGGGADKNDFAERAVRMLSMSWPDARAIIDGRRAPVAEALRWLRKAGFLPQ